MNAQRTTALVVAGSLVAIPASLLVVSSASADDDRNERDVRGTVAGARYEISTDKERGFYEVDADLDNAAKGSKWKLIVRHDGTVVGTRTATATLDDGRYEVDFREVRSRNTKGKDVLKVTIDRVGGADETRRIVYAR